MTYISRLLGLGLLGLLTVLLVMSCETSKPTTSEFGSPNRIKGEAISAPESRQIVHFTDSSTQYLTPRSELAQAFIRQFGDGTVVDKILVRKAPVGPKDPVNYYLIGMGLRNGMFRAMALPLELSTDNELYLSTTAERYMLEGRGCQMCFFNFEGDKINGTLCDDNSGGGTCTLTVVEKNTFFPPKR